MTLLKREDWEGFVRDVDWTYRYVDERTVFPPIHSGSGKVPLDAWRAWEEDYKVTYPEYVATQSEKESAVYAVKASMQRSSNWEDLDEGWKSATKMHYGAVALGEYAAVLAELKMARFGLAGPWRNMAVFGQLDELRHASIATYFAHEFVDRDPQYDWAQKLYNTNNWIAIALRNLFDDMMSTSNVVDLALQLPLVFETGFTNLQFVALAADALAAGDVNFANMISSIQTDEARHSQQGGPTLEILLEHDPVRAQWVVDKSFWASARGLAALTGPSMDYYTPLEHRQQSYREFMEEWIIDQFVRTLEERGLKKPWYWDEFMRGLDTWHHALHLGLWVWRPTIWWKPVAAVSKDERAWLAEKYPTWERLYGEKWDVIIDNVNAGNVAATLPTTLPWLCSTCHLPTCNATQSREGAWRVRDVQLEYDGRIHHFCTRACRQIFWKDRVNVNQHTLVDRYIAGHIDPPDLEGVLGYMGLTPDVMGDDPDYTAWAADYAGRPAEGLAREAAPSVDPHPTGGRPADDPVHLDAVFADDFVHVLVTVSPTSTMTELAAEVARHAEGRRVRARGQAICVIVGGRRLPDDLTVAQAGLRPRDHVVVDYVTRVQP
jgi:toluene monooxygenase system protein A